MFRSPVVDGIVILIIALLILGPKRLPGLGKGLGVGMREFKEGITGESKDEDKPAITEAPPAVAPVAPVAPVAQDRPAQPAATPGSAEAGSERRP
jgi:sec-independent protein translocase protein TatA